MAATKTSITFHCFGSRCSTPSREFTGKSPSHCFSAAIKEGWRNIGGDAWSCPACSSGPGADSVENRLIAAAQLAYRHVHMADMDVSTGEVGEALMHALCEAMGDEAFQAWAKEVNPDGEDKD